MLKRISSLTFSLLTALAAVVGFFQLLQPVQAADLIVNPGESIQAVIDAAGAGDTIIIQAGSYTESFTINKSISLTGVSSDTVILHAEPNNRVLTVTGTVIDHQVVISGLTFTGGNLDTTDSCPDCGGGILITGTVSTSIYNIIVTGNLAYRGAGIYSRSLLTITNSVFFNNQTFAEGDGGGIYSLDVLTIYRSRFIENKAAYGGGITTKAPTDISDSFFDHNQATIHGAGIYAYSPLSITRSSFTNQEAAEFGGAILATQMVHITNSFFDQNKAIVTGGILADGGGTISNTQILRSRGALGGGVASGNMRIINSIISGTQGAGLILGGTYWISNTQIINNSEGGILGEGEAFITGSLIINNGGGVENYGGLNASKATIYDSFIISNTRTEGHGGGVYVSGEAFISNSLFQGNRCIDPCENGGGLYVGGIAVLTGTTFLSNESYDQGSGFIVKDGLTMINTVLFSNTTPFLYGGAGSVEGNALIRNSYMSGANSIGFAFDASAWVTNSQIVGNQEGGMWVGGNVTLTNSLIAGNGNPDAKEIGGLYVWGNARIVSSSIVNNIGAGDPLVIPNDPDLGGGVFVGGNAVITQTLFEGNRCVAPCRNGGGLYVGGNVWLIETTFIDNEAAEEGGGLFVQGALTMTNGLLIRNRTVFAGGGASVRHAAVVSNSHFLSNTTDIYNGGMIAGRGSQIINTVFANNAANTIGALALGDGILSNILFQNNVAQTTGSALNVFGVVTATHITIAQEPSDGVAAVYLEDGNASLILYNSIVSDSVTFDIVNGQVFEDYNLYFSDTTNFTETVTSGGHSIFEQDPLFVDSAAGNYRLQDGSPAIDAAVDLGIPFDLDGRPRPLGHAPDIGAYESGQTIPLIRFSSASYAVNEDAGKLLITITLDVTPTATVSVQLATADVSAAVGTDYTTVSETIVFPAGTTVQSVTVPILDDTAVEGTETLEVVLSNPQNGVLGIDTTALVTILDDDTPVEPPKFYLYLPVILGGN